MVTIKKDDYIFSVDTEKTEKYFTISVTKIKLPWVLDEPFPLPITWTQKNFSENIQEIISVNIAPLYNTRGAFWKSLLLIYQYNEHRILWEKVNMLFYKDNCFISKTIQQPGNQLQPVLRRPLHKRKNTNNENYNFKHWQQMW